MEELEEVLDGFQSTPPVKAATYTMLFLYNIMAISIHAAREGGDLPMFIFRANCTVFQSTPPVKAATYARWGVYNKGKISIHAAREGGDDGGDDTVSGAVVISIHAAREGGDLTWISSLTTLKIFQSTPPVKAATAETNRRNQHFRKQQV